MDPYPQMQDAKRRRRLSKATAETSAKAVRGLKTQNTPSVLCKGADISKPNLGAEVGEEAET